MFQAAFFVGLKALAVRYSLAENGLTTARQSLFCPVSGSLHGFIMCVVCTSKIQR